MNEDREFDALLRLMREELDRDTESSVYQDPWLAEWLVQDLNRSRTSAERAATRRRAKKFGEAMVPVLAAIRAERRMPPDKLRPRAAAFTGTPREVAPIAAVDSCLPLVDLAVAAGSGRELWDEPCDTWVELPRLTPAGDYVGLRISGDSMEPFLRPGDVIVVQMGARVSNDDVIVARLADGTYVVKCAAQVTPRRLRLLSFNPAYEPFDVDRREASVVGTVIARLRST